MQGNNDSNTVVERELEAEWCLAVRFYPTAYSGFTAMRVEVYYELLVPHYDSDSDSD